MDCSQNLCYKCSYEDIWEKIQNSFEDYLRLVLFLSSLLQTSQPASLRTGLPPEQTQNVLQLRSDSAAPLSGWCIIAQDHSSGSFRTSVNLSLLKWLWKREIIRFLSIYRDCGYFRSNVLWSMAHRDRLSVQCIAAPWGSWELKKLWCCWASVSFSIQLDWRLLPSCSAAVGFKSLCTYSAWNSLVHETIFWKTAASVFEKSVS